MGDDISSSPDSTNVNRQLRGVTHIFVHQDLRIVGTNPIQNDIALLRANVTFAPTNTFNPANRAQDTPTVNTQCAVAGWGSTVEVMFFVATPFFPITSLNLQRLFCMLNRVVQIRFNSCDSTLTLYLVAFAMQPIPSTELYLVVCFVLVTWLADQVHVR